MMRPLDMHVAFNAVPEFARLNSGEQASLVYRQMQALSSARNENLERPERVVRMPEHSGMAFNPDAIPILKKNTSAAEMRTYTPHNEKKWGISKGRDMLGIYFDATA